MRRRHQTIKEDLTAREKRARLRNAGCKYIFGDGWYDRDPVYPEAVFLGENAEKAFGEYCSFFENDGFEVWVDRVDLVDGVDKVDRVDLVDGAAWIAWKDKVDGVETWSPQA